MHTQAPVALRSRVRDVAIRLAVALERGPGPTPTTNGRAPGAYEADLVHLIERVAVRPFEYSVKRIAAELSVSPKTVERRFLAEGLGHPSNWIQANRVVVVHQAIVDGETSAARIARALGVRDVRPVRRIVRLLDAQEMSEAPQRSPSPV